MNLHSAIYEGHVRHRRRDPEHAFTFPLFMVYLDLREVDTVLAMSPWWGTEWWRPARFRPADYHLPPGTGGLETSHTAEDLDRDIRACVEAQLGRRPDGPVRMLTHLRYFGHIFNPVTFYYCFDRSERIDAVVAEITNTPWGQRHAYVLDARPARERRAASGHLRWKFQKRFHVSPFMPMDMDYDWAFVPPGDRLFVHMNLRDRDEAGKAFDATLRMDRRELTPGVLRSVLARHPLMTMQVVAGIHIEALKLWLKRAPVSRHPGSARARSVSAVSEGMQT